MVLIYNIYKIAMSILGIDFGLKRIGLAITDELNLTTNPLVQISYKKNDDHINEIIKIINERAIKLILVGVPYKDDGRLAIQDNIEDFASKLIKRTSIKVTLWNENFTSKEAEELLISKNFSRKKRKDLKDMLSACNIIDSYLRSLK
tara:strand:- start:51543 stop:51983 length:441 start_codon:yes stop_codon:yes gene_type:complete